MKYQNSYFNKRYGKHSYDEDDKLEILLGSESIAWTVRYVVPKLEIQIIKLENQCREWTTKIDKFKTENCFGDGEKLYQVGNAVSDIRYLISSNENDDGPYHFMEFQSCVCEDSPKEILEIYEELSDRRTNTLNKLNEYYKVLSNELLKFEKEKEKEKAIEEKYNKGISHVAKELLINNLSESLRW